MAINKVIFGGTTLIDLTGDTVTSDKILSGYKAHDKAGNVITGTCKYDTATTDATATADEILATKTAYVNATKVTGTMTNNSSVTGTITSVSQQYTIPQGYHDGGGKVYIATTEQSKIVAENIRQGVTILGVQGSMSGSEDVSAQPNVDVTPSTTIQTIVPTTPTYNYLSQVTVASIPYAESANTYGITVTIG